MKRILPFIATFAALFCAWPSKTSRASACSDFVSASGNLAKNNPGGGPWVTPQCYGAVGNGSINDTTALGNAINSGFSVLIPCATYNITGVTQTVDGVVIAGGGASCVRLNNTTDGNTYTINNGTTNMANVVIRDIGFARTVSGANAALKMSYVGPLSVYNLNFDNPNEQDAVVLNHFTQVAFYGVKVFGVARDGFQIYDNVTTSPEWYCDPSTLVSSVGRNGIVIGGNVGGARIDCLSISNAGKGVLITTTLGGATNREIYVGSNGNLDENVSDNLHADSNSFTALEISGGWFTGSTMQSGISLDGQTLGTAHITGAHCNDNHVHCLSLNGVIAGLSLVGNTIESNGGWGVTGSVPSISCVGGNLYTANTSGNENVALTHIGTSPC